ncbi:MAG TPA: ribosome silencing factor [Melioribacteraceae bacterium]|mgnify:CR=1 FL=1|nr:ribosome silencing factor [Melioribacteraceae bacterium]
MTSLNFAKLIAELVKNKKGYDIKLLDLRKLSSIADFFVICSADSERQVKAIADEVDDKLSEQRIKCSNREGYETMNWILLDYFDVILHVFKSEARNYYNLEKFWGDAPVIEVKDEEVPVKSPKTKTKKSVTER